MSFGAFAEQLGVHKFFGMDIVIHKLSLSLREPLVSGAFPERHATYRHIAS